MDAVTERDVLVGVLTGDVETERIFEDGWVEVAGEVRQVQPVALRDLHTGDLGVDLRGAHEVPHRRRPADHLVDGVGQQVGVASCSSRSWSGFSASARSPPAIAAAVVSWPAVAMMT